MVIYVQINHFSVWGGTLCQFHSYSVAPIKISRYWMWAGCQSTIQIMLSKWKLFLCIEIAMRAWSGAAKIAGMYNARNIANQMHLTWKPQGLKASVGSTPEELFALVHRVLIKTSLKYFKLSIVFRKQIIMPRGYLKAPPKIVAL